MSRNDLFHSTKEAAIAKIQKELSYSQFVACLPAAVAKDKEFCQKLHQSMLKKVGSGIRDSTDELTGKVLLKQKLDSLDKVVTDPANCLDEEERAWRPGYDPASNQLSRDASSIQTAKERLESGLTGVLKQSLRTTEQDVNEVVNSINESVKNIDTNVNQIISQEN